MKKVLVVGSINMDACISLEKVPEAGESRLCKNVEYIPGGKGSNQAVTLARMGTPTCYVGCVGNDIFGQVLEGVLKDEKIDAVLLKKPDFGTGVAYILLESSGENRIIVSAGANVAMTPEDVKTHIYPLIDTSDMVLLQLEITLSCIFDIIARAKEKGVKIVVDAGPIRGVTAKQLAGCWCVSPNSSELGALLGRELSTEEEILQGCRELLEYDIGCVLLKRGSKGCLYVDRDTVLRQGPAPVHVVDTTCAGDGFTAGFCSAVTRGLSTADAIRFATACGAAVVTKKGAYPSIPHLDEVTAIYENLCREAKLQQ